MYERKIFHFDKSLMEMILCLTISLRLIVPVLTRKLAGAAIFQSTRQFCPKAGNPRRRWNENSSVDRRVFAACGAAFLRVRVCSASRRKRARELGRKHETNTYQRNVIKKRTITDFYTVLSSNVFFDRDREETKVTNSQTLAYYDIYFSTQRDKFKLEDIKLVKSRSMDRTERRYSINTMVLDGSFYFINLRFTLSAAMFITSVVASLRRNFKLKGYKILRWRRNSAILKLT